MTPVEAAWLAGLIDGEGCLDSPRGNPRVRIKMSDFDIVLRAADLMRAKTHTEIVSGRKPLLIAQVTGDAALAVLHAVLPYLGARRTVKATSLIMSKQQPKRITRPTLVTWEAA